MQTECNFRMCQSNALKLINNVSCFHRIRFQEITSRRNVVKQIFYWDSGSCWGCRHFLVRHFAAFNFDVRSQIDVFQLGFHLYMCNRSNGSQCFTSKAFGMQLKQIFCSPNFWCSVSFKRQSSIRNAHSFSIVDYLNQGFSGIFQDQLDRRCSGINWIFEQFFDNRSRTLNDFSCGDLISHMIW